MKISSTKNKFKNNCLVISSTQNCTHLSYNNKTCWFSATSLYIHILMYKISFKHKYVIKKIISDGKCGIISSTLNMLNNNLQHIFQSYVYIYKHFSVIKYFKKIANKTNKLFIFSRKNCIKLNKMQNILLLVTSIHKAK